jgi:hypothetical protein
LPGIAQIPVELIQVVVKNYVLRSMKSLIIFLYVIKELPGQWKEPIIVPVFKRAIKMSLVIIEAYHCYHHTQNVILYPSLKVKSIHRWIYCASSVWVST